MIDSVFFFIVWLQFGSFDHKIEQFVLQNLFSKSEKVHRVAIRMVKIAFFFQGFSICCAHLHTDFHFDSDSTSYRQKETTETIFVLSSFLFVHLNFVYPKIGQYLISNQHFQATLDLITVTRFHVTINFNHKHCAENNAFVCIRTETGIISIN